MTTKHLLLASAILFAALSLPAQTAVVAPRNTHAVVASRQSLPDPAALLDPAVLESLPWSSPFYMLQVKSKTVNELYLKAEEKFAKNAASVAFLHDQDALCAVVRCPFPADSQPVCLPTAEVWRNDHIEWFLQNPANGDVWQFLVDASGRTELYFHARKNGLSQQVLPPETIQAAHRLDKDAYVVAIKVAFSKLNTAVPADGAAWLAQVIRSGKSCGGHSSWSPTGLPFMAPDNFGILVFRSAKAYWNAYLAQLDANANASSKDTAQKRSDLMQFIDRKDADWDAIAARTSDYYNALLSARLAGKKLLLWQPGRYEDFAPDVEIPLDAAPISSLRMASPRNARAENAFALTNLSDKDQMFNIHFKGDDALVKALRIRETGFIEQRGGKKVPDPVFDLPGGSVVRVPANTTSLIWVNADCALLKPGVHKASLTLYPSYSGMDKATIDIAVDVADIDFRAIDSPCLTYTLNHEYLIPALKEYPFNDIILVKGFYPTEVNGKLECPRLDRVIAAFDANGISRKELRLWFHLMYPIYSNIKLNGKRLVPPSPEWQQEFSRQLIRLRDFLQQKYQIGHDQYFFMIRDEPHGDPDDPKSTAHTSLYCAKLIKSIDPKFRVAANPYQFVNGSKELVYPQTYDVLIPESRLFTTVEPSLRQAYLDSGKELWHYSVFHKGIQPFRYRYLAWISIRYNLAGPGMFYSLVQMSADGFNSYDSTDNVHMEDYGASYADPVRQTAIPSRRLEAWYQGVVDFRLARYCRQCLARHPDPARQKIFDDIVLKGSAASTAAAFDECRLQLLNLAKQLKAPGDAKDGK